VTPQAFTATVVGSPRIGPKRELKRATEGYWAGRTSRTELENVAATLRRDMWKGLADAGLDSVPVNTFSYYDQVLDTAGPGREDDRVVPGQQIGQRVRVELLDVGYHRLGAGGSDVVGVVGIAEDRGHLVATLGQDARQLQRDLAVAAEDDDVCHASDGSRTGLSQSLTFPMIRSMRGLPGGYALVSDAIVWP
jgi:hypothetical protein